MAITRRQFVTRLGALAAAVGFSQADVSQLSQAFAGNTHAWGGTDNKPRVIWVHGAECTGCSVSLLSLIESPAGHPVIDANSPLHSVTTLGALGLTGVKATGHLNLAGVTQTTNPFTLWTNTSPANPAGLNAIEGEAMVNIADVLIDVIDLQYHETVMPMGGDLAAQWLKDFADYTPTVGGGKIGDAPFVLVVEGALQDKAEGGAWNDAAGNGMSWCSIGCSDDYEENPANPLVPLAGFENDMASTVVKLAKKPTCAVIIPIGQCASFGGYPGCKPNVTSAVAGGFDPKQSQTGAMGTFAYLNKNASDIAAVAASAKVVNVPGCPTNPWWFVMTVVLYMADYMTGAIGILEPTAIAGTAIKAPKATAVDSSRRLKAVYPIPVHSGCCPRYKFYTKGKYALKPGDPGCLQKIGCKGLGTYSLCGAHGWNNQQPDNSASPYDLSSLNGGSGGHCTRAGHPCMACTEKGYPDSFVPYVQLG
jgi:hydrogenase small subunit